MRIFRHTPLDSMLVAQVAVLILLPFVMTNVSFVWWLLVWPIHWFILLNVLNTSLHHHTHWGTFNNVYLEATYELLLSAASGMSAQQYRRGHTIHHKYVNDLPVDGRTRDPISVFLRGQQGQRENVWLFCAHGLWFAITVSWLAILSQFRLVRQPELSFMRKSAWQREQWAVVAWPVLVMCVDWQYGLWMLLAVYWPALFVNYSWHYGEHYGAHHLRGDTTRDSVGIYNVWYNRLCFASGYHQEHHHRPGIHWSKLADTVTPMLPQDRVRVGGMHWLNCPWWADLRRVLRLS